MRVEKEKRKVIILCRDGLAVKGTVHINPGERALDFINDTREHFIAVTDVEYRMGNDSLLGFKSDSSGIPAALILNKDAIICIGELGNGKHKSI